MFIDFSKVDKLPEGVTPELLADEGVQNFIKAQFDTSFEARFQTEASGLQSTNAALKEEKRQLKEHLNNYKDIDLNEYNTLKEFKKNNGDATSQIQTLQSQLDSVKEGYETKFQKQEQDALGLQQKLHNEQLTNRVAGGISEHNAKFPTVALREGSQRWINDEAKKVWKQDQDGNFVPMNGDRVMTGQDGNVMQFSEWVNSLRSNAEFQNFFISPAGGGSSGSGGGGSRHFNPKDMAGSKEERRAAIAAKYDLPTD